MQVRKKEIDCPKKMAVPRFHTYGEWSLCMRSGHYVWGVVIMYGEWSLCMGSGHYVWGVVIMYGEWSLYRVSQKKVSVFDLLYR
jgi:hypothetical protein